MEKTPPKEVLPKFEELKREIERKIETKEISPFEEKRIKEEIKHFLEQAQMPPSTSIPTTQRDEAEEIAKFSRPEQVGALVNLVFERGLEYSLNVARQLDNPAILDEFHDTLIDKYYQLLVEYGIIQQ